MRKGGGTEGLQCSESVPDEIVAAVGRDALLQHGADINLQTSDGFTALMLAAATGHEHVVDSLLRQGAEVDLQSSKGVTALMFAVSN